MRCSCNGGTIKKGVIMMELDKTITMIAMSINNEMASDF